MTDRQRLDSELQVARRVMEGLLPRSTPTIEGFDIGALNQPSYEVGGDYYEFIPLADHRWGIVTADVVGNGVAAALLVAATRASLFSLVGLELAQRAIMRRTNEFLHNSVETGKFVTLFYGVMHLRARRLIYVNAGHPPPVLLRSDGQADLLEEGGIPLGLFPDAHYLEGFADLKTGDVLALYTDGVTEAANEQEQFYGRERLIGALRRWRSRPAAEICREVIQDVSTFGHEQRGDDRTLVILKAT